MSFMLSVSESILKKRPIAVLMRHAERHPFIPGSEEEPLLTHKGHRDSYKLGKTLKVLTPARIFHSPITRCLQTAQELCRGLGSGEGECRISGEMEDLGPTLFVIDWKKLLSSLEKQGPSFLRVWIDGRVSRDLIVPAEAAAGRTLEILKSQLSEDRVCTINISHDWNIILLLEHYFNLRHEEIGNPDYLSGIVAYSEHGALHLIYGDQSCELEL